jgi:hypothetical protein
MNSSFITHRSSLVLFCLMTSDGTLRITGFGLVKAGLPEETSTGRPAPMLV